MRKDSNGIEEWNAEDEARRLAHKKRIAKMKQEKRRIEHRRRFLKTHFWAITGTAVAAVALVATMAVLWGNHTKPSENNVLSANTEENEVIEITADVRGNDIQEVASANETDTQEVVETFLAKTSQPLVASADTATQGLSEEVISTYAVLIDLQANRILAERNAFTRMNPASMTKVLTILVAAEHLTEADLDDTFSITLDITDYSYVHDCSSAGFLENEVVTVRDLFYGTVLPSGGDAAVALATYVAGSQEAFVELMNEELVKLGIGDSAHFTNCVGVYDENHYCTVYDMAVILKAAIDNEFCKEVLSAHTSTLSATEQHPEGIPLSNWFLRRIEDHVTGYEVICGKTGYVTQAGNCAASYAVDANGEGYICVTGNATSGWRCIYDQVAMYDNFLGM